MEGHQKRLEYDYNLQWNQTRHLMALEINMNRAKDAPYFSPQSVWPLSFDKKKELKKPMTAEEQEALIKKREGLKSQRRQKLQPVEIDKT